MWGKKEMNIHDKEIVGFLYKKNDQLLVLLSSDENNIFFNLGLDFTICFVVKYEMVIFGEVCPKIPEYIGRAK